MSLSTMGKKILQETLTNEDAFATSLLAICLDEFGTEILEWDPKTLWMEAAQAFGVEVPSINRDKLQSLIVVYTTDLFHISVEMFSHVCNVLSGSEANFRQWDMVSPEEALWGIYEVSLHVAIDLPHGEEPPEFSHEVRRYIGIILKHDGITDPPDILRVAEMEDNAPGPDIWSDDPEMFNAAYDKQQEEKRRLMGFLAGRLADMLTEINRLPLQNKDVESWRKFRDGVEASIPEITAEYESASRART